MDITPIPRARAPWPINDLTPDEHPTVILLANAFRQARLGHEHNSYVADRCTQDDVNRARETHRALQAMRPHLRLIRGAKP